MKSPQDPAQLQKIHNPLEVMSPGELTVAEIKRHPFGLIGVYAMAALLVGLLLAGVGFLPQLAPNLTNQDKGYVFVIALLLIFMIATYVLIATTVYKGNRWVVTSDSITQITQVGLFQKQTSQLSLENLEDVTFEQNSFIQNLFDFGTLHVETAGEHSKFLFPYCPQPNSYAKLIIQAHEQFIADHPEGGRGNSRQWASTNFAENSPVNQTPPAYPQPGVGASPYDPTAPQVATRPSSNDSEQRS